jgi:hypothetical protein
LAATGLRSLARRLSSTSSIALRVRTTTAPMAAAALLPPAIALAEKMLLAPVARA